MTQVANDKQYNLRQNLLLNADLVKQTTLDEKTELSSSDWNVGDKVMHKA